MSSSAITSQSIHNDGSSSSSSSTTTQATQAIQSHPIHEILFPIQDTRESGESSSPQPSTQTLCGICVEMKEADEMFRNEGCVHSFCSDCITKHVASKIQANIHVVSCPGLDCRAVLEPDACMPMLPKEVLERWNDALCEAMVLGAQRLYCPFSDCSTVLMIDNEDEEAVRESDKSQKPPPTFNTNTSFCPVLSCDSLSLPLSSSHLYVSLSFLSLSYLFFQFLLVFLQLRPILYFFVWIHAPVLLNLTRSQSRTNRSMSLGGMEYPDPKRKNNFVGKILLAATLTALCIIMLKQSPSFNTTSSFSIHEAGVTHVLVTGGAGFIGSHAALRLLRDRYRVTIVDNLSRGNIGAIKVLQELFPEPGRLQFIYADLGDPKSVNKIFSENAFDAVMHFAAVAYVGESTLDPLKYYHNITSNTLGVLEAMASHGVKTLIYSSTCATYGEPEKMPITEETPQLPINPYGKAKKMAEDIILDFHKNSDMAVMILRYFNVIGSDPEGRLGEAPRPELREHGRISGACFDAARGITPGLKVRGTDYKTSDGTCIRDYIDVTDLVDAHVKALEHALPRKVGIYNVGTGKGSSVKEFVEACKKATGVDIKVDFLPRRPGDYAEVFSDPSKILRELNWSAQHTNLQESLQVAWRWQKAHRDGYGTTPLVMSS